jgi:hypothetical protein
MRPLDQCPYARPFPSDFDDCEAFQPVRFIPLSSEYRPLAPALTCRHLISRKLPAEPGRWYAACAIGDVSARRAWVDAVSPTRLEAIARLREEMAGLNATFIDQLWGLKGQQLEARQFQRDEAFIDRQMQQVAERFIAQTGAFLADHLQALEAIDVTADSILYLLRISVDHLIKRSTGEVRWEIPESALAEFSPPVRLFFRPPAGHARPTATVE